MFAWKRVSWDICIVTCYVYFGGFPPKLTTTLTSMGNIKMKEGGKGRYSPLSTCSNKKDKSTNFYALLDK